MNRSLSIFAMPYAISESRSISVSFHSGLFTMDRDINLELDDSL
jgi:hypothetical protein